MEKQNSAHTEAAWGDDSRGPRQPAWYRIGVTGFIFVLGAFEGWFKRTDFSTDAISYLDISRAIPAGDWKMVFNPLWSIGYPLLLATARPLFPQTPDGEWLSIHIVNFAIFIGAWFAFQYLLSSALAVYGAASEGYFAERRRLVFIAGACIFLSIQLCIDSVSRVGPDLLVSTLFFLGTALVLRLTSSPSYGRAAALGIVLGLGYWTKGIFLALALSLLLVAAATLFWKKRRFLPILLSVAVFTLMVVPYAAGLSWSYKHLTLGESGPLNYAFHVNYLPRWTNWQGEPGGYGKPIHPTQQLLKNPDVFGFAEPYHNTYPPFGNIAYWYEGYRHFWSPKYQAVGIARDLKYLVQALTPQPIFYAVLLAALVVFVTSKDRRALLIALGRLWPLYLGALIGVALYVQVHLEDRYLGSFLTILCLVPFLALAANRQFPSRAAQWTVLSIMILGGMLNYVGVDREVLSNARNHSSYAENPEWKKGLVLMKSGLRSGEEVAVVGGPNASCTWAYIAHLRIVAEMGGEPFDQLHPEAPNAPSAVSVFWHATPVVQREVLAAFERAGASVAIASQKPADVAAPAGWQHLEGTDTWIYHLH